MPEWINAIEIDNVTKIYRRYAQNRRFATLKSALLKRNLASHLRPAEMFTALREVSFCVAKGGTFGVVGRNGSGKSTLLKLIAGITKPTHGEIRARGRISALIELGTGFHPEISGRENVVINGVMLGLSKREISRRFDEIVEFAELEDFIDAPVKTYSSGMYLRLGFAVAIHVDPEILLIDEVLAVGDEAFSHRCLDKFAEFKRRGKTILLVTHALGLVERFCDGAVWLDEGRVCAVGDPPRVVGAYITHVEQSEERQLDAADVKAQLVVTSGAETTGSATASSSHDEVDAAKPPPDMFGASEGRWGSREVEIVDVSLVGNGGRIGRLFHTGERMEVHLKVNAPKMVSDFVFGISLFSTDGVCCYGTNTDIEMLRPKELVGAADVVFTIDSLDLVEGTYKLDVAVHKRDGYPYDYHRLLHTFRVKSRTKDVGIYRPRHRWKFSSNVRFTEVLDS